MNQKKRKNIKPNHPNPWVVDEYQSNQTQHAIQEILLYTRLILLGLKWTDVYGHA